VVVFVVFFSIKEDWIFLGGGHLPFFFVSFNRPISLTGLLVDVRFDNSVGRVKGYGRNLSKRQGMDILPDVSEA